MGKAWKFGDNINTDLIIPAEYLHKGEDEGEELAYVEHIMEPIRPSFANEVSDGDVIVAGENFGCGSSREHAVTALIEKQIDAVVAASFARIYFRNAINAGLSVYISPEASSGIDEGDEVIVDRENGFIRNTTKGEVYESDELPAFCLEIANYGGLAEYYKKRIS